MRLDEQVFNNKRPSSSNNTNNTNNTNKLTVDLRQEIKELFQQIIKGLNIISNQNKVLNNKEDAILNAIRNFKKLSVPSQIELTNKQLYMAYKNNWTLEQLSGLSGFDEEEIKIKIQKHMKANITGEK